MEIDLAGDAAELPLEPVTSAVLVGFLGALLSQKVNMVNARSVAEQQGYRFREMRTVADGPYSSLLTVKVRGGGDERRVAGTVFGKARPKIVRIDDSYLEMTTSGDVLLFQNDDAPGRLAAVTAVLARHGLNICDAALGRDQSHGHALSALALDGEQGEELITVLLDEVRAEDGVLWADYARL